jgi:tellurite resistance protein
MNTSPATLAKLPATGQSVKYLPVNLFGAVMGISGLSLAWGSASETLGASAAIAPAIGIVAIVAFALLALGYASKLLLHPQAVRSEFEHPVAGNFFGTITISLLLLSTLAAPYSKQLQVWLWTGATAATLVLSYVIISRMLRGAVPTANVAPAWLIPGVASLDIAVAGASLPMQWAQQLNLFAAGIGTMMAIVFFVFIFSRLTHGDPLPNTMIPSLMIMMAPFEIGYLAYTSMTGRVDLFAGLLFYFGLFIFLLMAVRVFRRHVAFTTAWWAISFPLAALANAALKYAAATGLAFLSALAMALLALLTLAIAVLLVRTLHVLVSGKLLGGQP